MTAAERWLLVVAGLIVGMLCSCAAYRLGVASGQQQASHVCLDACERQATARIDDLLAKLAARGLSAR